MTPRKIRETLLKTICDERGQKTLSLQSLDDVVACVAYSVYQIKKFNYIEHEVKAGTSIEDAENHFRNTNAENADAFKATGVAHLEEVLSELTEAIKEEAIDELIGSIETDIRDINKKISPIKSTIISACVSTILTILLSAIVFLVLLFHDTNLRQQFRKSMVDQISDSTDSGTDNAKVENNINHNPSPADSTSR